MSTSSKERQPEDHHSLLGPSNSLANPPRGRIEGGASPDHSNVLLPTGSAQASPSVYQPNVVNVGPSADPVPFIDAPQRFGEATEFWEEYDKAAEKHDQDMVKGLSENVDVLLVFAGLFSGVNTAFIVLSLSLLSAGPSDETNTLLRLLVMGVDNSTLTINDLSPPQFVPSLVAIRINCFFAASLACSLMAAFGAMLGKQWVGHYARTGQLGPAVMQGRHRQMKFTGVEYYHFRSVVEALPTLLQIALFLFFIGLTDFLRLLNTTVAQVVLVFVILGLIAYVFTVIAATIDPYCPFQTPVSTIARRTMLSIRFSFLLLKWRTTVWRESLSTYIIRSSDTVTSDPRDFPPFSVPPNIPRPTRDTLTPARVWEDGGESDATSANWILETSARKEALLGAARGYIALYRFESNEILLQSAAFKRLVSLLKESLRQLKASLDGPPSAIKAELEEAVIVYGRAVCHAMIGSSRSSERQIRGEVAKELDNFWSLSRRRSDDVSPELWTIYTCFTNNHYGFWLRENIPALPLYIAHIRTPDEAAVSKHAIRMLSGPTIPPARVLGMIAWSLSALPYGEDEALIEELWQKRWDAYTSDTNTSCHLLAALKAYPSYAVGCKSSIFCPDAYTALLSVIERLRADYDLNLPYNSLLPPEPELFSALEGMLPAIVHQLEYYRSNSPDPYGLGPPDITGGLRRLQPELLLLMLKLKQQRWRGFEGPTPLMAEPLWQTAGSGSGDSRSMMFLIQLMKYPFKDQKSQLSLFREYPKVSSFICEALLRPDLEDIRGEAAELVHRQLDTWFDHDELDIHQQFVMAGLIHFFVPNFQSLAAQHILLTLLRRPIWRAELTSTISMDALYNAALDAAKADEGFLTRRKFSKCEDVLRFWQACRVYPELNKALERWTSDELAAVITSVMLRPESDANSTAFTEYAEAVREARRSGNMNQDISRLIEGATHREDFPGHQQEKLAHSETS